MILTVSVVTGFQNKIRDKVISFGAHIQITALNQDFQYESVPVLKNAEFITDVIDVKGVEQLQPIGYRPGILQSGEDSVKYQIGSGNEQRDTFIVRQEIKSVLVKGIDEEYDWSFFKEHITKGHPPAIKNGNPTNDILISQSIAEKLHLDTGETVRAYFVDQSGPKIRKFTISGIYHTGMEEFDEELIYADLHHIQKLNNWGVENILNVSDTCIEGQFALETFTTGGNKNYYYDWGDGFGPYSKKGFCPYKDTAFKVIVSDFDPYIIGAGEVYLDEDVSPISIPDTAFVSLKVNGEAPGCYCTESDSIHYADDGLQKNMFFPWGSIEVNITPGKGTGEFYCGGFEVLVNDWKRLNQIKNDVFIKVPGDFKVSSIAEIHPEIFNWLDFLDTNVIIIITLMVVIAIINMSSALLVLILEKTGMIGMLKALGANSWSVRKVFLYLSTFLITRGLFWGNLVGIGLALIQFYFQPLQLDPEVYYLEAAPVELNLIHVLLINGGTMLVCLVMLIIPSIIINKISAIKAIRFD